MGGGGSMRRRRVSDPRAPTSLPSTLTGCMPTIALILYPLDTQTHNAVLASKSYPSIFIQQKEARALRISPPFPLPFHAPPRPSHHAHTNKHPHTHSNQPPPDEEQETNLALAVATRPCHGVLDVCKVGGVCVCCAFLSPLFW